MLQMPAAPHSFMRRFTALTTAIAASALTPLPAVAQSLVIDHVTVVDTRSGKLARDRAVVIDGRRIVRIARGGSVRNAARTVDATGKFVVPGYFDMHAHPLTASARNASLTLMTSYGVTGYRQMGGDPKLLAERKAGTLQLPAHASKLLATPGLVLAGPFANDPTAAAAQVREQKAQGADFIKVVDLGPEAFFAVLDAARAVGLPVAGHQPPSVDVREAVKRGMHAVEHLGPHAALFEDCSTDELALRKAYAETPKGGQIKFDLPASALRTLTANPVLLIPESGFQLLQRAIDTYDEGKCRALAKTFVAADSWQTPTLIRLRAMEFGADPAFRDDPRLRYVPAEDRQIWEETARRFEAKLTPANRATLAQLWQRQLRLVKLLDEAGVPMMAGSDFGGGWLIPGVSLHQEFDLLAEAGLSPLRILQMATLNGARFLGREKTMGTVEAGKQADLVLLDADPLASTANLHKIDAVVLDGELLDRAALDALAKSAEIS
nr:amidohydrolase family protein [Sphingomonas sp. Y57]